MTEDEEENANLLINALPVTLSVTVLISVFISQISGYYLQQESVKILVTPAVHLHSSARL